MRFSRKRDAPLIFEVQAIFLSDSFGSFCFCFLFFCVCVFEHTLTTQHRITMSDPPSSALKLTFAPRIRIPFAQAPFVPLTSDYRERFVAQAIVTFGSTQHTFDVTMNPLDCRGWRTRINLVPDIDCNQCTSAFTVAETSCLALVNNLVMHAFELIGLIPQTAYGGNNVHRFDVKTGLVTIEKKEGTNLHSHVWGRNNKSVRIIPDIQESGPGKWQDAASMTVAACLIGESMQLLAVEHDIFLSSYRSRKHAYEATTDAS